MSRDRTADSTVSSSASLPLIGSLTSLRGLLALWVVLFHFWNDVLALFPWLGLLTPVMRRGNFAVPGFFVLSGFLLARNYGSWFESFKPRRAWDFLALRLARIYPVHAATLLCVAAMVAVSNHLGFVLSPTGYSVREFLLNALLIHAWTPHLMLSWNYPSWSISSEWFAYLLFPGLVRVFGPPLRHHFGAVLVFAIATSLSISTMLFWSPWPFEELAVVAPTFFAGMACSQIVLQAQARGVTIPRWLPLALGGVLVGSCYVPGITGVAVLLLVLSCLVLSLAMLGADARAFVLPPLLRLGEVSYSLYMTHTLVQKFLYRALPVADFAGRPGGVRLGVLALYALSIAAVCTATYVLVERPGRRWGRIKAGGLEQSKPSPSLSASGSVG